MPKIRQAIAVFLATAFCIGFNTWRYPVVWKMVIAISPSPPSAEANAAGADSPADNPDESSPSAPAARARRGKATCKDGVCTIPSSESPAAGSAGAAGDETAGPPKSSTDEAAESQANTSEQKSKPDDAGGESASGYGDKSPASKESDSSTSSGESGSPSSTTDSETSPKSVLSKHSSDGDSGLRTMLRPKGRGFGGASSDGDSKPKLEESSTQADANAPSDAKDSSSDSPTTSPSEMSSSSSAPNSSGREGGVPKTGSSYPFSTYGSSSSSPGTFGEGRISAKRGMKLVSTSSPATQSPTTQADSSVEGSALVRVERPKARDPASGTDNSGAYPPSSSERQGAAGDVRPLPKVEESSAAETGEPTATVTPEMSQGYRVTSAK